ncbi:MAG: hypothetical protein OEM52_06070 [bacterium]|nr:hypothetical protein [bacterium]
MPPIITSRGFYWDEAGPPDSKPLFRVEWMTDWSATLFAGERLQPVDFTPEEARTLQNVAATILREENSVTIPLIAGGRFSIARTGFRVGISYLPSKGGWKRGSLSIIDLAQLVEQLFPPNIETIKSKNVSGIVITAPHSPSESRTASLTRAIADTTGLGAVIAVGYRDRGDHFVPHPIGRCINVNRPTEFVRTKSGKRLELPTKRAKLVFERYCEALSEAAQTELPLAFLIELHGYRVRKNGLPGLEIAGTGLTGEEWDSVKNIAAGYANHFPVRCETHDSLRYSATSAKLHGSLQPTISKKSLHIELSTTEREKSQLPHTKRFLLELIAQIILSRR